MRQQKITVIVLLNAGGEAELRSLLQEIGDDIAGNATLQFAQSPSTHFARFAIFDRDPVHRLLFSACHAGTRESYIAELVKTLGGALDKIFRHCQGYPPNAWNDAASALQFVTRNDVGHNTFVVAFPEMKPSDIIAGRDARMALDDLLDQPQVALAAAKLLVGARGLAPPVRKAPLAPPAVTDFLDRLFVGKRVTNASPLVKTNQASFEMEDRVIQNQLTVVSPNKPGIARLRLRGVLAAVDLGFRITGSLGQLPTIHFAQWSVIDNGDNLLFESNYDGTWENYIDDFIDYAYLGLDAVWSSTPTYPPGGARTVEAFKAGIRKFQYAAQVFYSAYPDCTVQNIFDDQKLHAVLMELKENQVVRRFLSGTHAQMLSQ